MASRKVRQLERVGVLVNQQTERVFEMSTITPKQSAATPAPLYRINVHEYERIIAARAIEDEQVELIDGYLVKKMGKNPPHQLVDEGAPEGS